MSTPDSLDPQHEAPTLAGLLDNLVDQGVQISGDLVIGLADVELIRVALKLLVASEDTAQRTGVPLERRSAAPTTAAGQPPRPPDGDHAGTPPEATPRSALHRGATRPPQSRLPSAADASAPVSAEDREQLVRGVSQLLLTIVELIRELIERQAIRRVEAGNLTSDQIERLGVALQALEDRMEEVKDAFGLTDDDLNLDLGPLGRLR